MIPFLWCSTKATSNDRRRYQWMPRTRGSDGRKLIAEAQSSLWRNGNVLYFIMVVVTGVCTCQNSSNYTWGRKMVFSLLWFCFLWFQLLAVNYSLKIAEIMSLKLCAVLNSIKKSCTISCHPSQSPRTWVFPLLHSPPVSHWAANSVLTSIISVVPQCLCSNNPILLNNSPKVY
jgi:hypothetical protein